MQEGGEEKTSFVTLGSGVERMVENCGVVELENDTWGGRLFEDANEMGWMGLMGQSYEWLMIHYSVYLGT